MYTQKGSVIIFLEKEKENIVPTSSKNSVFIRNMNLKFIFIITVLRKLILLLYKVLKRLNGC